MARDIALALAIMLLGAAGSVLIKVLAAHIPSDSFQQFATLT